MAQEPEEKLWLDRDLWEIPALFYGGVNPDYIAIMSRFHYLLLRKNPETYEELIKYWAFLIVTAPDAFDEDPKERYQHLISTKVHRAAIKFNRPVEKIDLKPGEPKLEEASNFLYDNWRVLCGQNHTTTCDEMDDFSVYRWYTEQTDALSARTFFGLYCLNLIRANTDQPGDFSGRYHFPGNWMPQPPKQISFTPATGTFLRDAFRSQAGTFLKILRTALDWYEYHTNHQFNRSYFFRDQVMKESIYQGLEVMKFAIHILDDKILPKLKSAIMDTGSEALERSLKSFNTILDYLNGVRLQDESFLKLHPHLRGEQCRFWPFSRYISPQYFKSLDLKDNLEFFAFLVGYSGIHKGLLDSHLQDLIDDKHDRKSLEEEIERGFNQGDAVYVLENPTK